MNSVLRNLEFYNEEAKRRYLEQFDESITDYSLFVEDIETAELSVVLENTRYTTVVMAKAKAIKETMTMHLFFTLRVTTTPLSIECYYVRTNFRIIKKLQFEMFQFELSELFDKTDQYVSRQPYTMMFNSANDVTHSSPISSPESIFFCSSDI